MRSAFAALLLFTTLLAPAHAARAADRSPALTAEEWRQDLTYLVATLEKVHPDLYARVTRERFAARVAETDARIIDLTAPEIVLDLMALVARVEDGHTSLEPVDPHGFGVWFPVRFHRFTDGIFITAIAQEHAGWAGARVTRIGQLPAHEAWNRAARLLGSDNEFGALQRAPLYLANAAALAGLGVIAGPDRLEVELVRADGSQEIATLAPVDAGHDLEFQFWGEIWGPAASQVTYVTPFGPSEGHYDQASTLPLHLRYRSAYWYTYLESERLFYVQINHLGDTSKQTFAEFSDGLWRAVDESEIDALVLDIRNNIGGDGSLVLPFVHELIKRDAINRKGTLFTVVGRATFSAGVMLARALEEHTRNTFVGEPPGAYWKHYGDGTSFELPHSKLLVWVSTIYHQLSSCAGDQRVLEIELPAQFSSSEYLGGRDPALEEIRASRRRPLLANVFRERGGAAGLAAYKKRAAEYGGVEWWAPFSLAELNQLGHELLEADRYEDALAAYRLNTERHPRHWRVWYSLARAQKEHGDREQAIENYERALAADPFNNLAPYQREALEELRGDGGGAP